MSRMNREKGLQLIQFVVVLLLLTWNTLEDRYCSNVIACITIIGGAVIIVYLLKLIQIMINKIKTKREKLDSVFYCSQHS